MTIVNFEKFKEQLNLNKKIYNRKPFNYIVIDDFLNEKDAESLLEECSRMTKNGKMQEAFILKINGYSQL